MKNKQLYLKLDDYAFHKCNSLISHNDFDHIKILLESGRHILYVDFDNETYLVINVKQQTEVTKAQLRYLEVKALLEGE